jgi:hypothetical protein
MVPPAFPGRREHPEYDWVLTVSRFDAAGELPVFPWAQASFPMTRFVPIADGNAYDVVSVVALHGGGAVVSGIYETRTIDEMTDDVDFAFGGSWIIRLRPDGTQDSTFGIGGVRLYPNASIMLTTELADGSLQGLDWTDVIRLTPDGLLDSNFGTAGRATMSPNDRGRPRTVEADGSWLDVRAGLSTAGLVRYLPNGTLDPTFGVTANPAAVIDVSTVAPKPGMQNLRWNELDDHQTLRLADGTFLTLWSVMFENSGWDATAVVLLAWAADGAPRLAWNGQAAKIVEPPNAVLAWERWYGRRLTGGLLQADGSVLVGVAADVRPGGIVTPQRLPWRSTFWRLTPPAFDLDPTAFELDPNFGGTGSVEVRLLDDGYNPVQNLVDVQEPVAFAADAGRVVYVSIQCGAVKKALLSQNAASLVGSPDLPFDGSLGIVRLV